MGVKLRKRKNSDGTTTLLLDIYHNGERKYEFLKHLKLDKPASPEIRKENRERLLMAEEYLGNKIKQLAATDYNLTVQNEIKALDWMNKFKDGYQKKDKRNIEGAIGRFEAYLKAQSNLGLPLRKLSETVVMGYKDYLVAKCKGEGAHSYFARFKKMIKQAVREGILQKNPCEDVKAPIGKAAIKHVLTFEEIQILANTHTEAEQVKLAFLFCCVTGLRWIDIVALRWSNIDLRNSELRMRQVKTGEDLCIKLNGTAISILGKLEEGERVIFDLPTADGANKSLKAWVERAEIKKKITWHCARHSFGTNLLFHGSDVFTASKLLGHSSVKHTQRYVRAADEMKQEAVNKLPEIIFMPPVP